MLFQLHITLNGIPLSPSAPQFVQCLHQTQLPSCQLLSEELPWAIAIPQKQSPSRKFSENHWKRGESMGCHDIAMTFWRKKRRIWRMSILHPPPRLSLGDLSAHPEALPSHSGEKGRQRLKHHQPRVTVQTPYPLVN